MGSELSRQRRVRVAGVTTALLLTCLFDSPAGAAGDLPLNTFQIAPGATIVLEFEVTVDNPLDICATTTSNQGTVTAANHANVPTNDPDTGAPNDATLTPLDAVDLAITKTDGAATEVPGTPVTYTIVASNSGPAAAIGATVADTFPATLTGVTWTCVGAGGGTCTAAGAGNLNDAVNLPVGGSVTYTVNATISPDASGTLANTATVTKAAAQIECNLANNSATDSDTLTPQVDLAITKTDGLTNIDAGTPTSYTITVANSGPSDAVGATVADTFPATLLTPTWSCTASPLSSCTGAGAGNINDIVTVRSGGTLTYTVNATVSGSATGTLSNTATVAAAGGTTDTNAGNNSATDNTTVNPIADLSITKSDGTAFAVPGMTVTYTIVAANAGPATATGASVADTFPASLTCNWTCVGAGGGTCTAGPVAGNIADAANLPANGTATYTAVCTLADSASGSLVNTATISGGGVTDNTPANNSATDTDTILPLDFGDAPTAAQSGFPASYPTLLAGNGARHGVNGGSALRLGTLIDTETDGQPTANADGDDQVSGPNVDDEDGVGLPGFFVTCESASVTVTASAAARLDAFVDFDRNGSFADAGEKVLDDVALAAGPNNLSVPVPCGVTPTTLTFARFRLSTAGALGSTGVAADGEVEDYPVAIRGLDFGDAPDPTYPTLFASNGARHVQGGGGPILGALVDADPNGQPNGTATGDDVNGTDDEDGIVFSAPLVRGQAATVTVTASAVGTLSAWVDWNGDGSFATAGDQLFTNQAVAAGANVLGFTVPATATPNAATFARFRVATAGGLSYTGLAADGEVEDHGVAVAPEADLSITKTDGATSEVPGTPVTYTIVASNGGPNAASPVTVSDTFPAILSGCTWTSVSTGGATGATAAGAGNISDTGIAMPSGSTVTYTATCTIAASATGTLVNTATVSAATIDPIPGNNSATDSDTLTPEADLAITKTDGSATEIPGTPVTYTIVATNPAGPSNASATVADAFPATIAGVTWTCVGAGGGTCTAAGAGSLSDAVFLPVGGSVTYTATGTISAAATGTLVNTATVAITGGGTDPTPANNSATDTDTLTPQADLAITKTDGSTTEVPGSPVTYTITASNSGPSNAVGATVADTFPATISGVTWTCVGAGGGTCTAAGGGNISDVVNLPAGGSVTYTATGTIASSATGTLVNTATVAVAGGTTDPGAGNNSATDTDTLVPSADLQITKDDSADPPPGGQDLVYTLTVENLGPSDAVNVDVSDQLPAEVTYISDTCGGANGSPWVWNVGPLAAGVTLTCDITVSINPAPPDTITNTATVEASTADPDGNNNSDTELTELDSVPPTVANVDTLADTGDGTLAECETANVAIASLLVTFDEEMSDPLGDGDPGDVTNPANYLVVTPGPDFDFQTTSCGGAAGDDVAVTVTAVAYDDGSDTATLALAAPLAAAQHRLFACDSLTDLAGNPLDGDGDTTAGGDFARAFRADPGNLFVNGHFDCDAADWNETAANPAEVEWTGAEDADDADASGAVLFTNLAPGVDTSFALWQCYPVPGAPSFAIGARVRLDADPGDFIGYSRRCEFFSAPGCSGSLGSQTSALILSDTAGAWVPIVSSVLAPGGAVSARCDFTFETPTGEAFDAYLDATTFTSDTGLLIDGFETGDTSAWSATVP